MITPERIEELRRLCDAATPGPWIVQESAFNRGTMEIRCTSPDVRGGTLYVAQTRWMDTNSKDAPFIAAARTALPEALDTIEALRADLAAAHAAIENLQREVHSTLAENAVYVDEFRGMRDELERFEFNGKTGCFARSVAAIDELLSSPSPAVERMIAEAKVGRLTIDKWPRIAELYELAESWSEHRAEFREIEDAFTAALDAAKEGNL